MVPAMPPLIREKMLTISIEIHVAIVTAARPRIETDLKLRRSSCLRPILYISMASAEVPVRMPSPLCWSF